MSDNPEFHLTTLASGWTVGRFPALEGRDSIVHAVTLRDGLPGEAIRHRRGEAAAELAETLGLKEIAFLDQVHGNKVLVAEKGGLAGKADALVTNVPSLGVMGASADCPLILMIEPTAGVSGMAHASWRSTTGHISSETVLQMVSRYGVDPAQLVACICPSAGPCCYEVGEDVRSAMVRSAGERAGEFFTRRDGRTHFDLWAANKSELMLAGLHESHIHVAGVCTICATVDGKRMFPSHRGEGESAGRFAAVIAQEQGLE